MTPWHVLLMFLMFELAGVIWAPPIILGWILGVRKGREATGILAGVLLSYFGLIIVALLPETHQHRLARLAVDEMARPVSQEA